MAKESEAAKGAEAFDPLRLDLQLCFALYTASNLMTRAYRPLLEPLGLTYLQYLALMALWAEAPQSIGDLGRRLGLDASTLTPLDGAWPAAYLAVSVLLVAGCLWALVARFRKVGAR